jgi:hypothetical protein
MITVSAVMNRNWEQSYDIDKLYIVKDNITIELNKEEWEHLQEVLNGKQEKASTKLEEGNYYPETIAVWSKKKH